MTSASSRLLPRPRALAPEFDASIPRQLFGGLALPTHLVNGVNLLFPAGERFFIRSVRHYLAQVDDPVLHEQAAASSARRAATPRRTRASSPC